MQSTDLIWGDVLAHLRDLAIAYALALPIGWDRERVARSAGVRTFPLVGAASCGFVLLSTAVVGVVPEGQARVLQGFITGIGFVAGGAVLKESIGGTATVLGMTTAVSLWTVGVAGAAVGYGLYDIAVILCLINFLTLRLLRPLKRYLGTTTEDTPRSDDRPGGQHL